MQSILVAMSVSSVVVDCTVIADLFVGEERFARAAENLRRRYPVWIAPDLWRYEFGNVLRTQVHLLRQTEGIAVMLLKRAIQIVQPSPPLDMEAVLNESNSSKLSFYDATYVHCAKFHGLVLYTRDKEILDHCPDVARAI